MNQNTKKILILTAQKGGGHRSSSNAIEKAILELNPNTEVISFDSLELYPGYTGEEKGYITFTTTFRFFWKLFFEFTSFFSGISDFFLQKTIFKRFKIMINNQMPDIILSVHPCFVGCVINCLKKLKLDIPFYTCIIDLVKHSYLWHDKRCKKTFVPTVNMYNLLLKKGFNKENLVHSGFPINEEFNTVNKKLKTVISVPDVLMVNPSLKSDKVTLQLILETLKHNVNLTVVTGSDKILKNYLDKKLLNVKNVTVLDYVFDMDKRLANADVLITKAGPNMILEAVKMCVPVIVTDYILGQEEKNYQYIEENGYGLYCSSPEKLGAALGQLFKNNHELLKRISQNQKKCNDTNGARVIAEHLLKELK